MKSRVLKNIATTVVIIVLCAVIAIAAAGCNKENEEERPVAVMLTNGSSFNDGGFNALCAKGLSESAGFKPVFLEGEADKFEKRLKLALAFEPALVWAMDERLTDTFVGAANANPNIVFGLVDGGELSEIPSNMFTVAFEMEQGAFLAGFLAAKVSKTAKIGFVGGIAGLEVMDAFEFGFKAGAFYANRNSEVLSDYVGDFINSSAAESIADTMYADGADVIFQAAGGAGLGVIQSAKDNGKFVIGVDVDQRALSPENVISSVLKRADKAVKDLSDRVTAKEEIGGMRYVYGIEDGGVELTLDNPILETLITAMNLDVIRSLAVTIGRGALTVPVDEQSYVEFCQRLPHIEL